jgi:hypothetical protein
MSGNTSSTGGYILPLTVAVDDEALEDALQSFVRGVTGLDGSLVRPRWQPQPPPQPAPTVNWAAVGIINVTPIGNWGFVGHILGKSTIQRHEELEVLTSFYGPNSGRYSGIFRDGALFKQNFEELLLFGVKLLSIGNTMHSPELINEQYIQRSDVTMRLARQIDRDYPIEDIVATRAEVVLGHE